MGKKKTIIPCKHCDGTGDITLADSLEIVLRDLKRLGPTPWRTLSETRARLAAIGINITAASLYAKLNKLVEHGLVVQMEGPSAYVWRAK
jgi:hypothetical protein